MIRRPPRSTLSSSSAASDVYKRQVLLSDDGNKLFGFTRGLSVAVLSAAGQGSGDQQATLQASALPSELQSEGTELCDELQSEQRCFTVSNGALNVGLSQGRPVVLFKKSS
eukprot:TRINITY_DN7717_c0_g1_i1.p1 TRINITY_DN7717_c0_g1~~TRINITY_DN7717_c0_g1_i1.p1  ORF type:complete len:111 (+),score=32.24 TRINITY_DN7717_c0_g1_i1:54-386(+)